jgi:hypothetical protein
LIDVALKFLAAELNAHVAAPTGSTFGTVELGPIVDDSGKWAVATDHVALSVVNLEEERVLRSQLPEPSLVGGKLVALEPPVRVVLHVLFAARFQKYDEAWSALARVLQFFQARRVFTPHEYPGLDPRVDKLTAELQSPGYEQLNQIWAYVGGKQLPSALYKVRLVALQDAAPAAVGPPVTTIGAALHQA